MARVVTKKRNFFCEVLTAYLSGIYLNPVLQNLTSLRKKSLQYAQRCRNYPHMDAKPTLSPRLRALFTQLSAADIAGKKQLAAAIRAQIADLLLGVTP